jgi:nucleoside-diphosphate-sugar epimerase
VRVVLASTRQVYGRPLRLPVDETHPTVPVDINGVHKIAGESYHLLYQRVHRLQTVILRLTNTYGPRMDLVNSDKGVIGLFVRQALRGETIRIFGSGEQRRDFNYIDDVVEALLLAGESDNVVGNIFNLGHPGPRSLLDFVSILQRITGCRFERVAFPEDHRAIDIGDYYGDFTKFHSRTGWQPETDVSAGLERTIAFFQQHRDEYLGA